MCQRAPAAEDVRGYSDYLPCRAEHDLPSFALGWAENWALRYLLYGVNALDYRDTRTAVPEFIAAYERMANLATKAGVRVVNV